VRVIIFSIKTGFFVPTERKEREKMKRKNEFFILKNISFNQLNLIGASEFNQNLARNLAFQGPVSLPFFTR